MKLSNISGQLKGNQILLKVGEWRWTLNRYGDLEEIWEAMEEDNPDERIPYWTELWPSSFALAKWLAENESDIRGRRCLDLGCGLGFTALLGQKLGAQVIAADYEPQAIGFCRQNAILNNIKPPVCLAMDWRAPALKAHGLYHIWAGDIIYEKRFIKPVLDLLDYALEKQGMAWIAEPGRDIFHLFLESSRKKGFKISKKLVERVPDLHNKDILINASVWEIKK